MAGECVIARPDPKFAGNMEECMRTLLDSTSFFGLTQRV
jgi:hypothetical protein